MKVKNRLKRRYVLFALSAVLFLFGATNVSALTKNIAVTDVAIKDKSGTVTAEEPALSDNKIASNVTFNQKDDFVAFELSIKNGEPEKYKIESIEDNNTNENIQVEYAYNEDFISTNESSKLTVKLTYKNALINVDKISINDLTIRVFLISEDGKSDEIIINPATSDALPYYLAIAIAAVAGLILLAKKKKIKGIKIGGVVIALSVLLIPLAVLAKEKYETQIEFTNIDIIGEFETYNITINPGNGDPVTTIPVKYGDKLTNLPANPSKDGHDFEKWVDDDGNTVTTDTVITGPITVEAKYTIKKYSISYDLDGGSLPDGKTNPTEYTIEDEITVNNPAKQGYTFIGWSGTGIDGKTTNLVIPTGSKDARSYVANYSANENTPYTVTHRYQNLDDLTTYTESTITEYGETGKTIPAPRQERTGFETPAVQNVKVEADGSAHITYTYDRSTYSYSVTNRTYITDDSTSNGTYPYETVITVKAQERAGYTFAWDDGDTNYERTFALTGATSLTPVYTAKTNTKYVVKHYKQKLSLDGYEIADTQNLTGTTDEPISPAVNSYTGFKSPAVQHTTIAGDGSTEVIYEYNREMYAFSFNDNENVTSTKPADSYPYGTVITLTANEVAGKTFSKWSNNETANPLTITLTGDLTIEPIYTDNTVTVTFNTNGGSAVDSQTINSGSKVTRPAEDPTKYNQLFYDWYTTDAYETMFDFNTEITTDTTIYARFVPSAFPKVFEQEGECIFNGSEGVLEGENCAYADGTNKYINTGVQLYIAENLKKDYEIGFTIKSYDSAENVRQATFMNSKLEGNNYPGVVFRKYDDEDQLDFSSRNTKSKNERKLWANQVKERVVRIYRITNKTTKVQEIFYSMDGGAMVKINDLSQFNPVFDTSVWFGAAPTNTSANVAQRFLVGTLSNIYIKLGSYEEPEGLTYTVSFDANGGSVSPASITKDKGDAIGELPTPTNIPAGKEFDGWYTELDEEGVKVDNTYTPNTGTTLYAKYKDVPRFTVVFNTDGGSSVDSQTVIYGGKATRPSTDPTKEGYIFDDWYTTSGYATVFDFANTAITTDTTIYAKFDVNVCKTFATDSWATIRGNLASDSNYYAVGCEKEVEIDMDGNSTPESYTVRLANTSMSGECPAEGFSQTACGTVIEFVDIVKMRAMNPTDTSVGGWKSTSMVTYLNGEFYNKLPSDLKTVIIPTYPIKSPASSSDYDRNDITEQDITKNKIYLLSPIETGSNSTNEPYVTELSYTKKLDYYKTNNSKSFRIKRDLSGTAQVWWLRSAQSYRNDSFYNVYTDGGYGYYLANYNWAYMGGVAPAFRIGTMPEFTVSFDTDGGSEVASQTVNYGGKAMRPSTDPTKEGYVFVDWYTSSTHDAVFDFDNTIITSSTTIYARYLDPCNSFGTDSWSAIVNNLETDSSYYAVGCEKEVEIDMDDDSIPESYTVRLANTSTPENCSIDGFSQTACGTVIEFVDIVSNKRMDSIWQKYGGYALSDLVVWLNSDFYRRLPNDLQGIISPTYPITQVVENSSRDSYRFNITQLDATKNKVYLLSLREVGISKNSANTSTSESEPKTRVIDYYSLNNSNASRIKKSISGYADSWWLRTPRINSDRAFDVITNEGSRSLNSDMPTLTMAIAPAFRIANRPEYYTVVFDMNGGSLASLASTSKEVDKNSSVGDLFTPNPPDGKLFDGWYTEITNGEKIDENYIVNSNMTLYAHYLPDTTWVDSCNGFSDDSWSSIAANLESNPNHYPLGCKKEVPIDIDDDGVKELYTVRIANTSTPTVCETESFSQTACGTVIEFADLITQKNINSMASNSGGWKSSDLATSLNVDLYNKLPSGLQSVIIPTYPIVSGSGSGGSSDNIKETDTSKNKIYLLSTSEIGLNVNYDNKKSDTRTLDYYMGNNSSRVKRTIYGDARTWWLRTATSNNATSFYQITTGGNSSSMYANESNLYGLNAFIAPAFRIGSN